MDIYGNESTKIIEIECFNVHSEMRSVRTGPDRPEKFNDGPVRSMNLPDRCISVHKVSDLSELLDESEEDCEEAGETLRSLTLLFTPLRPLLASPTRPRTPPRFFSGTFSPPNCHPV